MNGDCFDYCPRMHSISFTSRIWNDSVHTIKRSEVEAIFSTEQVQQVYSSSQAHLERMSDYFSKYLAKLLTQSKNQLVDMQAELNHSLEKQSDTSDDITALLALSMLTQKSHATRNNSSSPSNDNEHSPDYSIM